VKADGGGTFCNAETGMLNGGAPMEAYSGPAYSRVDSTIMATKTAFWVNE
jgi:hypothetical protein